MNYDKRGSERIHAFSLSHRHTDTIIYRPLRPSASKKNLCTFFIFNIRLEYITGINFVICVSRFYLFFVIIAITIRQVKQIIVKNAIDD